MKKNILIFLLTAFLLTATFLYFFYYKEVDVTTQFTERQESQRLQYFKEIHMQNIRDVYGLTGKGSSVAVMGEMIDPTHPDLRGRINKQYDTYRTLLTGEQDMPYAFDKLSFGHGHGTHIAGTLAANCDGIGLQGIACGALLDAYSFGGYDEGEDINIISTFIVAFSRALDHITQENKIKIATGSFNIESPAIFYEKSAYLYGKSASFIVDYVSKETTSFDDTLKKKGISLAHPLDKQYIKSYQDKLDTDDFSMLAFGSLLSFSKEWQTLERSIQKYQNSGGVYLVTESNLVFGRTSILNAMPSMSQKVDKDLWLSVVMVQPKGIETATNADEFSKIIQKGEYITPINDCGELAYEYCILTPSYAVLSTITPRIKEPSETLYKIENRTYQSFGGHSMGAPMVAGALALMQEYNKRESLGYTMKDLVRIIKKSANRDFKGYTPKKHGQGILNIEGAIQLMHALKNKLKVQKIHHDTQVP